MVKSAIDYLVKFIKSEKEDRWLQGVVISYLNAKESFSDSELKRLANDLLANSIQDNELNFSTAKSSNSRLIKLHKLSHYYGINALTHNQEIVFNDEVTVIYGLNGSGKSSYFRILQGMIGNISNDNILPNIYKNVRQDINTEIVYSLGKEEHKATWANNGIIEDLNLVNVFDSKYSQGFLGKRVSDEQILHPYKLYVFSDISNYIDQIKDIANEELIKREAKIIEPNKEYFTDNIKKMFDKQLKSEDKAVLNSIARNFDKAKFNELADTQHEVDTLTETNYKDKLKIMENEIEYNKQVKKQVEEILFSWIKISEDYHEQYILLEQYKKESEENRKKLEVFHSLPGMNSKEWKEFIKYGLLISSKSKALSNKCPYCQRVYDTNALEIIKAYSTYINDKTEEKLSVCKSNMIELINRTKYVKIDETFYIIEGNPKVHSQINQLVNKVLDYIDKLSHMEDSLADIGVIEIDTDIIINEFDEMLENANRLREKLIEDADKKDDNLKKKKERLAELNSEKSIHEQIDVINNYFDNHNEVSDLRKRINGTTSNRITRISRKAHEELLTNQLIEKFDEYLKKFGIIDREIKLSGRNSKGRQQTELVMKSQKNVTDILSEGEQKAVSIALFLAEIEVAQNNSTVVFDDPVNSLDHRMIECLSDVILQLKNQVIVFTHNRMFLDTMAGSDFGHFCKNYQLKGCNKAKGKHVFVYETRSEGLNDVGIITSYFENNARDYLSDAKELLNQSPFSETLQVCSLLRLAIDHIIDEVVFNGQIPRKYSMKGRAQSINWDELKKMADNSSMIDDLKIIFGRLSSGNLHYGQVSHNNPPDKGELINLYDRLESMLK